MIIKSMRKTLPALALGVLGSMLLSSCHAPVQQPEPKASAALPPLTKSEPVPSGVACVPQEHIKQAIDEILRANKELDQCLARECLAPIISVTPPTWYDVLPWFGWTLVGGCAGVIATVAILGAR